MLNIFKHFHKNYEKNINFHELFYNDYIKNSLNTDNVDLKKFKSKSILQISTYNTICGIADFAKALKYGLDKLNIKNEIHSLDKKFINHNDYKIDLFYYKQILNNIQQYDYIIFQHEFSFFETNNTKNETSMKLFYEILLYINKNYKNKKILIYLHTPPMQIKKFTKFSNDIFNDYFYKIKNIQNVSFIVNTPFMALNLAQFGIKSFLGIDPVKTNFNNEKINTKIIDEIKSKLCYKQGDKIIAMLGFINGIKRHKLMIQMLKKLPPNYKLLIIGGTNYTLNKPYNHLIKLSKKRNLQNRIFITGLFDNENLNSYLSMVDLMVAPYKNKFKSGSSSISMLMIADKPIISFEMNFTSLLNLQFDYNPIIEIEYNNTTKFIEKIISVCNDKELYKSAIQQITGYKTLATCEKLAKLVLKSLK